MHWLLVPLCLELKIMLKVPEKNILIVLFLFGIHCNTWNSM